MSDDFNPYHKWLGIPLHQQPANHYRLLGLEQGECDPDVIAHAAEQRIMHLKSIPIGSHGDLSRSLIDEISQACSCLLDSEQKMAYDTLLQARQNRSSYPTPPPLHSADPPEWLPRDDSGNKGDVATDDPFFEEGTSAPLPIHIETGSPPRNKTNGDRPAEINKTWEELDSQLADLPGNRSSEPDFANILAEEKQEKVSPPEPAHAEPMTEAAEATHPGHASTPMPPPFPPVPNVETPPAIGPMTDNAPAFPEPPPLPPTKNTAETLFEPQGNAPAWLAPKDETKDPRWADPSPLHPLDPSDEAENTLVIPDSFENGPDGEGESAGDIFAPAPSTGTSQPKNALAKANRKKHKRIFWLGHFLAPIMGLILGWIILQYLKTN